MFQALDEVAHHRSSSRTAGGGAIMGAAAEGPAVVNPAPAGVRVEQRAAAIRGLAEFLAAGGPPGAGGHPGLATGEVWRAAC